MVPVLYRVTERVQVLSDTVSLRLEPDSETLPTPTPGQFTMMWAFGIGEAPISIESWDDGALVQTIRRVGAVTTALHDAQPGDLVGLRGPYGTGWGVERATGGDIIVAAGGLGLAPVLPVVSAVLHDRAAFGRLILLVGARSPDTVLHAERLDSLAGATDIELAVTVDVAGPEWRGEVGVVTELIDRLDLDPGSSRAFVCGPEIMMRFAAESFLRLGLGAGQIEVSLERNMECGIGHCGHCQLGPHFLCVDGPVLAWATASEQLRIAER